MHIKVCYTADKITVRALKTERDQYQCQYQSHIETSPLGLLTNHKEDSYDKNKCSHVDLRGSREFILIRLDFFPSTVQFTFVKLIFT